MAVIKQIVELVSRAVGGTEKSNALWKAAIAAAVKRGYSTPEDEKEVAQYVIDSAPYGVRAPVVNAFRRCGYTVDKVEGPHRNYTVQGIRDRKVQAKVFEMLGKNGEGLPDLIAMADKVVTAKTKELKGTPAERAETAITKFLARLSESDPAAKAIANDRLTAAKAEKRDREAEMKEARADVLKKYSGCIIDEDGSEILTMSAEEYHAVMATLTRMRLERMQPKVSVDKVEKLAKKFRRAA